MKILGTMKNLWELIYVTIAMVMVLILYKNVEMAVLGIQPTNYLEIFGTLFGLITVWLARTENILSWPTGIACVVCLGLFFIEIDLPGQALLNLGYFLPISLWAWWHWAYGGEKKTVLPVTNYGTGERVAIIALIITITVFIFFFIGWLSPGSQFPFLDSTVVASSVVAQYLLARKKVESWWLWLGPVNALSITLFALSGAYVVMALYFAFFVHAAFAIARWNRTIST